MSLSRWLKLSASKMAKVVVSAAFRPATIVVLLLIFAVRRWRPEYGTGVTASQCGGRMGVDTFPGTPKARTRDGMVPASQTGCNRLSRNRGHFAMTSSSQAVATLHVPGADPKLYNEDLAPAAPAA